MYAEIKLDCQTKTEYVSCEYCIAQHDCQLKEILNNEKSYQKKNLLITTISALTCQSSQT
jgi:hypothetical protein